jgi:hypothetical protein
MFKHLFSFIFFSFLIGCEPSASKQSGKLLSFEGRFTGYPLHQIELPPHWEASVPKDRRYLEDSTLPVAEFYPVSHPSIKVRVHTFPSFQPEQRISPSDQVNRWRMQGAWEEEEIAQTASNGFGGLRFFGREKDAAVLGYALQMNLALYYSIENHPNQLPAPLWPHARADITFKVCGPVDELEQFLSEIDQMVSTFQLLEPVYTEI